MKITSLATLALLATTSLLQGCISALVIGGAVGAAAVTTSITDPRSLGSQVDDKTLYIRVMHALNNDPQLKNNTRIAATIYQSKVLLTGTAATIELANYAEKIVKDITGVSKIYNVIRQGNRLKSVKTVAADVWITTKVRSILLANVSLKALHIKVTTENGEVFLMGHVTEKEAAQAAEIASNVDGVTKVLRVFTYVE